MAKSFVLPQPPTGAARLALSQVSSHDIRLAATNPVTLTHHFLPLGCGGIGSTFFDCDFLCLSLASTAYLVESVSPKRPPPHWAATAPSTPLGLTQSQSLPGFPDTSTAIMSAPQANEAEKNIEIWKVKKLIKRLEAARGNGTSMISLIIRMFSLLQRATAGRNRADHVRSSQGSGLTRGKDVG